MKKLIQIQSELKAPKNQFNKFGNYRYRSAEDILEAVKPLLAEHQCLLFISDTIESIGGRNYVKATVTFQESDLTLQVSAFAREEETKKGMDGSQITGASSSYARKYALNGLFLIDDTKDSDSTNEHDKGEKTAEKPALPKFTVLTDGYDKWVAWFAKGASTNEAKFATMREKFIIALDVQEQFLKDVEQYKINNNKKP